ncbi:MAG: sulfotransferase [Myxococcales bacterium]|nr:sulfotransferase [Myxococcales bacterium]
MSVDRRENARRAPAYQKDLAIEDALAAINDRLERTAEPAPPFIGPLLLTVGPPRSGTTLLTQQLARAFDLTIPDNIVARFWRAPDVGVTLSRALRHQFERDALDPSSPPRSTHGVTRGPFEPHEFGYFWQRFFDFSSSHALSDAQLRSVRWDALRADLARMQVAGGGRPLSMKGVALSLIIEALATRIPEAVFLHVERDPRFVAQSMLSTRRARYGRAESWWSVVPANHDALRGLPPVEQVVGQLEALRLAIARGLATLPAERRVTIAYDHLCERPHETLDVVAAACEARGVTLTRAASVRPTLPVRRVDDPAEFRAIERALATSGLDEPPPPAVPGPRPPGATE